MTVEIYSDQLRDAVMACAATRDNHMDLWAEHGCLYAQSACDAFFVVSRAQVLSGNFLGVRVSLPNISRLARALPDGVVTIEVDDCLITWRHRHGCAQLNLLPATPQAYCAYPPMADAVKLDGEKLLAALKFASVTAKGGDGAFGGVILSANSSVLEIVGTNGHWLGHTQIACPSEWVRVIAPEVFGAISRICLGGMVEVWPTEKDVVFVAAGGQVSARLIEMSIPEYGGLLRRDNPVMQFSVDCGLLIESLGRLHAAHGKPDFAAICELSNREMTVQCVSVPGEPSVGGGTEAVPIELLAAHQSKYKLGLNAQYLRTALSHLGARAMISCGDPLDPVIVRGGDYTAVIMPLDLDYSDGEDD